MKKLSIGLILLFYLIEVRAQDSLTGTWLDEVVITGQYEAQSVRNSVYEVRVIPMEVIQARGAVKLEDVLNTQLNMRFSQDAAIGSARLSMQGISGQSIKILIDGVPVTGRQGVLNEIDINQINIHTVERIEIVEGPMAVMYGADALAGVINIITKKNEAEKWSITAGLLEKSVGNEYGLTQGIHNQNLAGQYAQGKWHASINLAKNYFGGWTGQELGREKAWHPKDQIMAGARVGFKPQSGEVYYRLDYLYEHIYNPGPNPGPNQVKETLDEDYITNRFMHQVQGSYKFSDQFSFLAIGSYTDYSRRKRTVVVETASGKKSLSPVEDAQNETKIAGMATRGTLLYKTGKRIAVQAGFDINLEYGKGNRIKENNQGMGDYALFGSVEWKPLKGIWIRPGLRVVYNSVYGAPPVVPSLNTKWEIADHHAIRLSYGYGFRAPSLRELYFTFFDNSHSIEGNTDLKAETSHSVNGAWNWEPITIGPVRWSIAVGAFYNAVENKIDFGQKPGGKVFTYININNYQTNGVTLSNEIKTDRFDASIGLSYTHTLFWSPEVVSAISYKIPKASMTLSLYYKYTGQTLIYSIGSDIGDSAPTRTGAFHTIDCTVQKKLFNNFMLTVGVQNALDVTNVANVTSSSASSGTHSSAGATTPIAYGRSYFVGVAYTLNRELNKIKSPTVNK